MTNRVHLTYREPAFLFHPNGWLCPAHFLSECNAAAQHTWQFTDCPGEDCGVRR